MVALVKYFNGSRSKQTTLKRVDMNEPLDHNHHFLIVKHFPVCVMCVVGVQCVCGVLCECVFRTAFLRLAAVIIAKSN